MKPKYLKDFTQEELIKIINENKIKENKIKEKLKKQRNKLLIKKYLGVNEKKSKKTKAKPKN